MRNSHYGDPDGSILIYFFGMPGSHVEASIFHEPASQAGINVVALDRVVPDNISTEDYLQELCRRVTEVAGDEPVSLMGFSIGASIALRVAAILGDKVDAVYLLSPAAPLEIESNTEGMGAGRYTFMLAKNYPRLFVLCAWYQALLTKINPVILLRLLFSGARGKDTELMSTPDVRAWLADIQKTCFRDGISVYDRDVKAYVEAWAGTLPQVSASVSIWHGEQDNWAPFAMSDYLISRLKHVVLYKKCSELSHYSCLIKNAGEAISAAAIK